MINKTPKNKKIKLYGTVENINGMFSNYFTPDTPVTIKE
jgi:hypothetical protein